MRENGYTPDFAAVVLERVVPETIELGDVLALRFGTLEPKAWLVCDIQVMRPQQRGYSVAFRYDAAKVAQATTDPDTAPVGRLVTMSAVLDTLLMEHENFVLDSTTARHCRTA